MFIEFVKATVFVFMVVPFTVAIYALLFLLIFTNPPSRSLQLRRLMWRWRTVLLHYPGGAALAVGLITFGYGTPFDWLLVWAMGALISCLLAIWWLSSEAGEDVVHNGSWGRVLAGAVAASYLAIPLILMRSTLLAKMPMPPNVTV